MTDAGADTVVRVREEFLDGGCFGRGFDNDERKWRCGGGGDGGERSYAVTVVVEMNKKGRAGGK